MIAVPVGSMAAKLRYRNVSLLSKFPCQDVPKTVRSERNYMIHILFLLSQFVSMRFFPCNSLHSREIRAPRGALYGVAPIRVSSTNCSVATSIARPLRPRGAWI